MMKAKARVSNLKEALSLAKKTVGRPNAMNGFEKVLISLKKDGLSSITSGNGPMQTEAIISDCSSDSDVNFLVSFVKLFNVVRTLPEDKFITLTLADSKMKTSCGKSRSTISCIGSASYPLMVSSAESYSEVTEDMITAFDKVAYAAAKDNATRKSINGITLDGESGKLAVMAADTHQVGIYTVDSDLDGSAIIPYGSIDVFKSMLVASTDISITDGKIILKGDGFNCIFNLLDERPAPIKRLVPSEDTIAASIIFSKENIIDSLSRVLAVVESSISGYCTLEISADDSESVLTGVERGTSNEVVEMLPVSHNGEGMTCVFNPRYLLSMLSSIDEENIEMRIHNIQGEPIVFSNEEMTLVMTQIRL